MGEDISAPQLMVEQPVQLNPACPPLRGLSWSSQGQSRGVGMGKRRRHSPSLEVGWSKDWGRCSSSVLALPLPCLPFQGAVFTLIQRETKQGREGVRENSLSAPLSVQHGSWRGGVGEAESGAAYSKPLKRLSRVTGSNFTCIVWTLFTPAYTQSFPQLAHYHALHSA